MSEASSVGSGQIGPSRDRRQRFVALMAVLIALVGVEATRVAVAGMEHSPAALEALAPSGADAPVPLQRDQSPPSTLLDEASATLRRSRIGIAPDRGRAKFGRDESPVQHAMPTRTPHPAVELPLDNRLARCRIEEVENIATDPGIDSRTIRSYDSRGLPLRELFDSDGFGAPDGLRRWYFDAYGNVERVTWDESADGIIDSVRTFEYLDGRLIQKFSDDRNGDGTVDRVVTFRHNATGLLVERTSRAMPSGSFEYSISYEYDDQERLTEEREKDSDGMLAITRYRWDGSLLTQMDMDFDNDGTVDYTEKYEYDLRGLLTRLTDEFDRNGLATKWHTYQYNKMGLVTRSEDVESGVGVVGWFDHVYDPVGRPLRHLGAHLGLPSTEWTFRNECPEGSVGFLPLASQ